MLVQIKKVKEKEKAFVSSLELAKTFNKDHRTVLKEIRRIKQEIIREKDDSMMYQADYIYVNKKRILIYLLSYNGFVIWATRYVDKDAIKIFYSYIISFEKKEKVISEKECERERSIAIRNAFTNAIKQSRENERMHGHAFSIYTNLIYSMVFNKNAKQLRNEFFISEKDNLRDYFSQEELKEIQKAERLIASLIECGWEYSKIKDFVENEKIKYVS